MGIRSNSIFTGMTYEKQKKNLYLNGELLTSNSLLYFGLGPGSSITQKLDIWKIFISSSKFTTVESGKQIQVYITVDTLKILYLYNTTSDNRAVLYIISVFTDLFFSCIGTPYHNSFNVSLNCYLKVLALFWILIYIYNTMTAVFRKCSVCIVT